jgi:lipopolysaccharide export system protein LptA
MPIIIYMIIVLGLLCPAPGFAEVAQETGQETDKEPLIIKSNTLEIDNKKQTVLFTGNVAARKSDFTINCDRMLLHYLGEPSGKESGNDDLRVEKVIATGQVKIVRREGGEAMADKAVYFQEDEKVILTGNPVVKQGNDFVEGSRITFFLKEKRSIVESSGHKKVRAVLYPKSEKR